MNVVLLISKRKESKGRVHRFRKFLFCILIITAATVQRAEASHAAGGYVSYEWLHDNVYRFTVTFYRDCAGLAPPSVMEIDLYSSCGFTYFNAYPVPPSGTEIGYPCPSSTTCNGGTNPGFQKYVYQVEGAVNTACTDWVISFQPSPTLDGTVLIRNSIITTLNPPLGELYTETTLDNVNHPTNSSITFINDPILFICAGQSATFNIGATDPDGDSLYYELVDAKESFAKTVSYVAPLSALNPLFPVGSVTVNPNTGDITINTSTIQVGVIDVRVKEYKNGVLVGSVVLDMQIIVKACANNYPDVTGINGTNVFTDSVCAGEEISFVVYSGDPDAGQVVSMVWNSGIPALAYFSASGTPYPTGTFMWQTTAADARSQPYTFTIAVKDNACPTNGFEIRAYSIYVVTPGITVSPSTDVCEGGSVSLTAQGASSYIWSPATGLSATTGGTVTASPVATTTYTVTGNVSSACSDTKTVTVTVNPKPSIGAGSSSTSFCNGQSATLTATGGLSYSWSPGTGLSATTGDVVTANPSATTTYTVSGSGANGCTATATATLTVNPPPAININVPSPVICAGQSVSLTANGASIYNWSPGTGLSTTSEATVTANPSATTTYTVSATDANGCSNTTTVTVTVNALPVVSISPPIAAACAGQSVSLTAGGATSYIWSPASGLSATTGANVTAGPAASATYTVTGTDGNGCSNTKSIAITINPLPDITAGPTTAICSGQSVALTAGGGATYIWSPATGLSATTGTSVTAGPASTTTYSVTGTDGNGCSNTKSVTLTVNPLPVIDINPAAPVICNGQSVSLTASGGSTYAWSPASGLSATAGANVLANPSSTKTFTVVGTDGNGCSSTKAVTVTVNPLPVITISPTNPSLCNGQATNLTASGAGSYAWSPAAGLLTTTGTTVTAGPSTTTTYTVVGTDANGCSATKSVTLTINPLPVITVSPVAPFCIGQSAGLTAGGGSTYIWSPATGLSATTGTTVTASPSSTTSYTVTGTDGNGCSNTKSVTVTVNPLPVITASPAAPAICVGNSVSLTAGGGTSYAWLPAKGLSATTGATVSASPSVTTTYIVTGTDGNGCSNTKSSTVTVNPRPVVNINPTAPVICIGQSVPLTASGALLYNWSPSSGLSETSVAAVSAFPTATTTYTVIGTDANGCSNTKSVTVTVNPLPAITAVPPTSTLCNGASVILTAGGGTTYAWSPAAGLSGTTGPIVTASPSSSKTYTVTGTDANGCSNTKSVSVTVNPLPTITTSPSPSICNGASALLTAAGGTTYSWSPATGLSATTGSSVMASPAATTIYTITGTDANGCTGRASVTVSVTQLPVVSVVPPAPVLCNGASVSLTASGATSYDWSPTTYLSTSTGSTVVATPAATATYIVTGTIAGGCTASASVTVTVNPLPVITASPLTAVICLQESVQLTAQGGATYAWTPATGLSADTGASVSATPSSSTIYTVTGTDANGCSNTASLSITVNPLPVITVNPLTPAICSGQSVSLTAGGGITYAWSPTAGISSGSGTTVVADPLNTTSYTVTGTDANGCSADAGVTVLVNPMPVVSVNTTAPVLCNGQAVSLTASGATSYLWSPLQGLSSDTGASVSANPSSTSSYVVTGTDVNGCTNTADVTVTVNPLPVIRVIPPAPVICNGESVLLSIGGGIFYTWTPGNTLSADTGAAVTASPSSTTTYSITGTDANGCSNSTAVTVTVNPLPVITATPASPVLCFGESVALTAGGGLSYIWSPVNGLSADNGSMVIADPLATTAYTVAGTDANGCSNTAALTVTINPLPVIAVAPPAPLCIGQSADLTASGAISYLWSPATGLSADTGAVVTASPSSTSIYLITGTDANGCSNTSSVTVTVNPLPVITVNPAIPKVCIGNAVTMTASGGVIYNWSPANALSSDTGATVVANPTTLSTYTVLGTDNHGCSNTTTVTVNVNPLPVVQTGPDQSICIGASVQLNASGPAGSSYAWSPSNTLSCSTCPNPTATPPGITTYIVTVTDTLGCSAPDTVVVFATPLPVQAGPDTIVCSGSAVPLHASGGTKFMWTPSNGLSDTTSANPIATVYTPATYTVTITSGSCSSTATVAIDNFPYLPVPFILQSADTLTCTFNSVYKSYQWYLNTNIIPNATESYYVATQTGNYNVAVTDTNGCSISVGINIVITGMNASASSGNSISIYPNPATDQLTVYTGGQAAVILYNMLGEIVYSSPGKITAPKSEINVDVSGFAQGVYFVEVVNEKIRWLGKFVKE